MKIHLKQYKECKPIVRLSTKGSLKYFGVSCLLLSGNHITLFSRFAFIFICVRVRCFCATQRTFSLCSCNYLGSDYGQWVPIKIGNIMKSCCCESGWCFRDKKRTKLIQKWSESYLPIRRFFQLEYFFTRSFLKNQIFFIYKHLQGV